jgi:hypothetical protein
VNCRICLSVESRVIRSADRDGMVRGLRRCTQCGHQWATREVPEADVGHTLSIVEKARELATLVSGGSHLGHGTPSIDAQAHAAGRAPGGRPLVLATD